MKNNIVKEEKRIVSMRLFSLASIIIALIIIIAGNILFDGILGDKLSFDLTSTNQNSITQASVDMIDSLPQDISIRIVGLFARPETIKGTYYEYIVPLLDDYQARSGGRIRVEYIDPTTYPSIISELDPSGDNGLSEYLYVVKCGDKIRVIDPVDDCYTYDQDMYNYYGYNVATSNIAESAFSSAILEVTGDISKKAYFMSGLANSDSHEQLSLILEAMGIASEDLFVSDEISVPDDCDILFIVGINSDLTERAQLALTEYIQNGGKVIVAVNYADNPGVSFDNLNLALYNVDLKIEDFMIMENDPNYSVSSSGFQSYVVLSSEFSSLVNNNTMISSYMRPVTEAGNPMANILTSDILLTSSMAGRSYYDSENDMIMTQGEYMQFAVARYGTIQGVSNPPEVYVFGSTDFTSDNFILRYGNDISNISLIRSIIRQATGVSGNEVVASKPISDYSIDYTKISSTSVNILTICLMVVIPLTLVVLGVVIYNKRKNL
ncbi:MAG: GldG family protein [Clostridiales bacterium]|nr:GldG family protein [Clostridiales bacterium]